MAKPHQQMRDYQRKHRRATSEAMRRHAESRACPKCDRGGALKRIEFGEVIIYLCRYCGHEHSHEKHVGG